MQNSVFPNSRFLKVSLSKADLKRLKSENPNSYLSSIIKEAKTKADEQIKGGESKEWAAMVDFFTENGQLIVEYEVWQPDLAVV